MAPISPRRGGRSTQVAALLIPALVCVLSALAGPATAQAAPHHSVITRVVGWSYRPLSVAHDARTPFALRLLSRYGASHRPVMLQTRALGAAVWTTVDHSTTDDHGRAHLVWRAPSSASRLWLRVKAVRHGRALGVVSLPRLATVTAGAPGTPQVDARVQKVLSLVNQARATARTCGTEQFAAASPLTLDSDLDQAAGGYATLMATDDFFSHDSPDGTDPGQRITAAGYTWHAWGENIAAGQQTPDDVVNAWLASPGHCSNLMSPDYADTGIGVATDPDSTYGIYWVQDFAHH